MKRKIHKMAGIFLSVCIAAGSITLPRVVSSAAGDTQTELSDKEDTQVQERKENSFRYKDGQPIDMPALYADEYEYAWEKVDGYYRNNVGAIIEGATRKGIDVSHHQQQIDWEKSRRTASILPSCAVDMAGTMKIMTMIGGNIMCPSVKDLASRTAYISIPIL